MQSYFENRTARFEAPERYWTHVLAHHRAWWAEATLFAAAWLLFERLRVRRIYYHTHEGGLRRKQIFGGEPPRSLYTQLPRRSGFELTRESPALLRRAPRKRRRHRDDTSDLPWYRLVL